MKKLAIVFAFALLLGVSLSSCRSLKPPCPAYDTAQVEQIDTGDYSK